MKLKKKFKGCVKIPLDTTLSQEEMLANSHWFGDWKTKGKVIFSQKRRFTINVYAYNLEGQLELTTYTPNPKLHYQEMKSIIELVIDTCVDDPTQIDFNKSYITISC